jgi:hypothetical protein
MYHLSLYMWLNGGLLFHTVVELGSASIYLSIRLTPCDVQTFHKIEPSLLSAAKSCGVLTGPAEFVPKPQTGVRDVNNSKPLIILVYKVLHSKTCIAERQTIRCFAAIMGVSHVVDAYPDEGDQGAVMSHNPKLCYELTQHIL